MKRFVAVAGTAVCALVAAAGVHLWAASSDTETTAGDPATPPRLARAPRNSGISDGEVTAPGGALDIRGRVRGPAGPMAGVVVAAFATSGTDTDPLARAICPEAGPGDDPYECDGGDETSAAVADVFASRSLERPALARATTDAEGRFALEGLAAGSYDVWAEREGGFASAISLEAPADEVELLLEPGVLLQGKVEVNDGPPKGPLLVSGAAQGFPRIFEAGTREGGAFTLGPMPASEHAVLSTLLEGYLGAAEIVSEMGSERATGPDEVVLSLASPRRIAGVVLDDGRPAAGVTVALEGDVSDAPDVVSDASGRFVFERVRPGDFSLHASKPFAVGQENVTVPADRDPPAVTLDLLPVGLVRGTLRDEAGHPVADASVFLAGHEVVHTGADGRFELTEAGTDERLIVRADGFLPVDDELSVAPGVTLERDITLHRAVVLRGTVVDEVGQPIFLAMVALRDDSASDSTQAATDHEGAFELEAATARAEVDVEATGYVGARRTLSTGAPERITLKAGGRLLVRLADTDGKPVPDASVVAVPLRGSAERRTVTSGHTSGTNEYALAGLTAGDYRVEVRTDSALEIRMARSDGRGQQELEVRLPALGKIDGKVVGAGGAPMSSAYVRATEVLEGGRGRSAAGATTDDRGEFHLAARRGGRYRLLVIKDNRPPVMGVAVTVDGPPVTIVLTDAAKVHGRVLYPDGAPASVFTLNGERFRGPEGRFTQEVSPGDLRLTLAAPGHAPRVLSFSIQSGEDQDVGDLTLAAGRTVAIRVVDARTSAPVSGANVHVAGVDASNDPELATSLDEPIRRTRSDGSTALTHVPDRAMLAVDADGYQPAAVAVGAGTSEVVRLEPNGTMHVFLDDAFEGPLWASVEGPEDRVLPLDPTSGASFRGLPSGEYTVVLWRAPPAPGQKWNGTLAPVQPMTVQFPVDGGGEVHFRMRGGGTDVLLQLNGVAPDAEAQLLLVPSGVDIGEMMDNPLSIKVEQVVVPERPGQRGPARFASVPDGTYRAAAMIFGGNLRGMYVDPRPLVLKAGGGPREVVMTVPDDWRPEED